LFLYDEDGARYEVDADDCEFEDGGFWLLAEDEEDEYFYEYCADLGDEPAGDEE
jgi:hypothetical protein